MSLDNVEAGMIKNIVWKRRKTQPDVDDEREDPSTCQVQIEKKQRCDSLQLSTIPSTCNPADQSYVLPLIPLPKVEECCSNKSIVMTGTACRGRTGPPIGVVDIGVSKSAYYFCIALPGVNKDPGEFSCEVQRDGKVCVQGVTLTGAKTVKKYCRDFEMKFQQQCRPGPFTLYFSLPGPVDPRLFRPTFRSDGIFEAVVAKYE